MSFPYEVDPLLSVLYIRVMSLTLCCWEVGGGRSDTWRLVVAGLPSTSLSHSGPDTRPHHHTTPLSPLLCNNKHTAVSNNRTVTARFRNKYLHLQQRISLLPSPQTWMQNFSWNICQGEERWRKMNLIFTR